MVLVQLYSQQPGQELPSMLPSGEDSSCSRNTHPNMILRIKFVIVDKNITKKQQIRMQSIPLPIVFPSAVRFQT